MGCSHCGIAGHTYRRCPAITPEEKKAKSDQIKKEKEEAQQRREERREQRIERERENQLLNNPILPVVDLNQPNIHIKTKYEVTNMTDYEMVLYWSNSGQTTLKKFSYVASHSSTKIECIKEKHRIVSFPFLEVSEQTSNDAMEHINIPVSGHIMQHKTFDIDMKHYDGTCIIIDSDYKPKKTELEEWKECALKSKFLLDQIYKMTGGEKTLPHYENIESFIDMIQDIHIPRNCSEIDKELAGVPSTLTNIT
tara:strand:- start:56 stop:811 length:756 start_codon:yes stop_codon:yes gene_type:complete